MIVRQFNEEGQQAFRSFLQAARTNPAEPLPNHLLEDDNLTIPLRPHTDISRQPMIKKRDAAEYLSRILKPFPDEFVADNAGLWTWLSLLLFDEVCPAVEGKRKVRNDYHYVFEPKNSRHYYRHVLFISWQIQRLSKGKHNRLLLETKLATLDKVTTEVMKRLFLTRIDSILEMLDRLYWDETRGRVRERVVGNNVTKGNLTHRLPIRIQQLEKTYDLQSLSASEMIELLGEEFSF